jgi:excisionase family DNA binding protein
MPGFGTLTLLVEQLLTELKGMRQDLASRRQALAMDGGANRGEALWTVGDVAHFLTCSTSKVYSLAEGGTLPALRPIPGGHVRFDHEAVRAWARGEVARGGTVLRLPRRRSTTNV